MIRSSALFTITLTPFILQAAKPEAVTAPALTESLHNLPLAFERNSGQAPATADFLARGAGYGVALYRGNAHISLHGAETSGPVAIDLRLAGARRNPKAAGRQALPGKVNYFIGNDPSRWRTDIATFGRVEYSGVYPGVDLAYYGRQGRLEYDFIVAPGGDPSAIRLGIEGARRIRIGAGGDLVLETGGAPIRFRKPVTYQTIGGTRRLVRSEYRLAGARQVAFSLGAYDRRYPLVIDPSLAYSTYLGGSGFDYGTAIAVSSHGNAFVTGYTSSLDFPTKSTRNKPISRATRVSSWPNSPPTAKVWSTATYLGGSDYDYPYSIAVDSTGAAYCDGADGIVGFPDDERVVWSSLNGPEDAFVTKFGPAGSAR
jgi:hypothetical protein